MAESEDTRKPVVFVDLDQCSKDAGCLRADLCRVVAYCGRAYTGPTPKGAEIMQSDSMMREAADSLFHYDLGRRVRGREITDRDTVYILSRDASWHNALVHLKDDGIPNVSMCTRLSDFPSSMIDVAPPAPLPKSAKALQNYIANNVAPDDRERWWCNLKSTVGE
eukprot:jgi/Mesvir1/13/Mv19991-RA.1